MERERVYENGYRATKEFPEYIDHYIYFSTQRDADSAAAELVKRGLTTQVRLSAAGEDWLLLATQPATGNEEMEDIYCRFSEFAENFNGHYDGWERPADFGDDSLN